MGLRRGRRRPIIDHGKETLVDEGPDDLWPSENAVSQNPSGCDDSVTLLTPPLSDPEQVVSEQWGLQLPSGEVHWNHWQGIALHHPIERLKMVAALQKTALDIGLSEGEQSLEFLAKYSWVTRKQHATVRYEDTGGFQLTAPEVSGMSIPEQVESNHGDDNPDPGSAEDVCAGPVGGDAC